MEGQVQLCKRSRTREQLVTYPYTFASCRRHSLLLYCSVVVYTPVKSIFVDMYVQFGRGRGWINVGIRREKRVAAVSLEGWMCPG